MTVQRGIIPVLAAPMFDPSQGRVSVELAAGLSLDEIVRHVLPGCDVVRERLRVALVTDRGSVIVPSAVWHRVYPNAGVNVIVRLAPGKDAFKSLLQIVVSIAAVALGQFWAPGLASTLGISRGLAQGLISLGVSVLGNLLINALIPPPKADDEKQNRYTISGWRNRIDQDGAIPVPMGEIRFAPPFACLPYTEIVGDFQYVVAPFLVGYGRVVTEDYRIGETSIAEYKNIDIEVREGVAGEGALSLFPRQIVEEQVGAELTRPLPRDELGEIVSGPSIETPVVRTTGADASGASIIFGWPAGLFSVNDKGKLRRATVTVLVQERLVQAEEWADVVTLNIQAKQREAMFRQHTWNFPSRGRWQIRVIMVTPESTNMQLSNRTSWVALQTIRPEYPIAIKKPMALVAVRVKATHQLNGQLDNFNMIARRHCLDYDMLSRSWVERATRNPASLYRFVLQSAANARPVPDTGIDFEQLESWHDFCRVNNLKYDRVIDDPSLSLRDVLTEIAAAGRASPRHDGRRWGVVVDRPQPLIVDHFSPRNAHGFKISRSYVRPPHGIRVQFLDATNDFKPAERLVRWPGYTGDITEVERMEMPGKTDPDEIYIEVMRRMFEIIHRPDSWRLSLDTPIGVATRGDRVRVSLDTIERSQLAARVKSVTGNLVEIDEIVEMELDKEYGIRFRGDISEEDTVGTSVVRRVRVDAGPTMALALMGAGKVPAVGSFVHFGLIGSETTELVVLDVEAGEDMSRHLRLTNASPIIDELIGDLDVPAWSGRIGAEVGVSTAQPPTPRFTSIASGMSGAGAVGEVTFQIEPGTGTVPSSTFEITHRLVGAPAWTTFVIPVANGGSTIRGYATGALIELQARAKAADGTPGPPTAIITLTVGGGDLGIPVALDASTVTVGALLGGAVVQYSTKDDSTLAQVQIYRSMSAILNRNTDAVGAPRLAEPSRGYSAPIGDTTRQNLAPNGTFDNATGLTLGPGWSVPAGMASHAAGSAGGLSQAVAFVAGKYYRFFGTLSAVTAGSLTPQFTGGTTRSGTARTANGDFSDRVQAVTGNVNLTMLASATFAGSLDNVGIYEETSTCLAQGTHYFWLEPQNEDGVPGPVVGPFTVTIR